MAKKRRVLKFSLIFILALLILFVILTGYFALFTKCRMDAPCRVLYDEANNCVKTSFMPPISYLLNEDFAGAKIESFLTYFSITCGGAGCDYTNTENYSLEIGRPPLKVELERINGDLKVNGAFFKKGEEFGTINIFSLHPWEIYTLSIKNFGLVDICGLDEFSDEDKDKIKTHNIEIKPRLVVIGRHGSYFSPIKGLLILLVLILALNKARKIKLS